MSQEGLFAGRIEDIQLEDEIQRSYLDYAMSVIVGRALPDVRDGLKPVHQRILWAMLEAGYRPDRPHRKSAAAVGDVLKKYHPHGDQSVYDALVRMAQDWSLRYPLVDGPRQLRVRRRRPGGRLPVHGGAARADGHGAAARHRGRDRRLRPELRRVRAGAGRPARRFPNLLVNGSGGIAVGMATNIPPHNLGEVDRRGRALPGQPRGHAGRPDEVRQGARLPDRRHDHGAPGHQRRLRDRPRLDQGPRGHRRSRRAPNGRPRIVVTELPYQVNKARLAEKIAELVKTREDQGHRRPQGRVQPRGHAAGDRAASAAPTRRSC